MQASVSVSVLAAFSEGGATSVDQTDALLPTFNKA